jgi:uncharacterized protein
MLLAHHPDSAAALMPSAIGETVLRHRTLSLSGKAEKSMKVQRQIELLLSTGDGQDHVDLSSLRFHGIERCGKRNLGSHGDIVVINLPGLRCSRAARAILILLAAALTWCAGAMAAAGTDLYQAQAIVTGQGEVNRIIGFASCLEDVLIKVSGAQQLAGDRRLAAYKANAKIYVRAFSYHDQMSGKPHRDEQGTRDRPYDLTVDFEEKKVDGILKALGLKPWHADRPRLALFVEMKQGPKNFIVTSDGSQSDLQRDALRAAADRRGMAIVLPGVAALTRLNPDGAELKSVPSGTLAPVAAELGGEVALVGELVWDDRKLGWASQWQMAWRGRTWRWKIHGGTFDEAFRRGIGGAAQVLSGNGDPGGRG